ncbi:MAG: PQQ-like beta-propeller repeat protein [bacterium]|nr:PQQ-like beta-propeller repeat protein [bacterium]
MADPRNCGSVPRTAFSWCRRWLVQHHRQILRRSQLLCVCLVFSPSLAVGQSQPNGTWASFQNGGNSILDATLPVNWSADDGIKWQVELTGYGQSSPVVQGDRVFVTSTSGKNKEQYHLSCYQLTDGQRLWQKDFENPSPEENTSYISRAAPSPAADELGVYSFFEGGLLVAVDHQGDVRWRRNLVEEYGAIKARHGLAASLEQNDSCIFVWVERSEGPFVLAVQKSSGENLWKADGLGSTSWSSPRLISVTDESQHLVCSAGGRIAGYDPATGARLWEFSDIANNTSCTPIPAGVGRFLIGASDGRGEENSGSGAASNGVIQIEQKADGKWSADFLWRAEKATCSFGSPIVANASAYLVNRVGALYQIDVESGQEASPRRIKCGSAWATPLVADGKLYIFGQKGTTSVIDLASGKEIATNPLTPETASAQEEASSPMSGPVLYAAVAASPYIILRQGDRLIAVGQ